MVGGLIWKKIVLANWSFYEKSQIYHTSLKNREEKKYVKKTQLSLHKVLFKKERVFLIIFYIKAVCACKILKHQTEKVYKYIYIHICTYKNKLISEKYKYF